MQQNLTYKWIFVGIALFYLLSMTFYSRWDDAIINSGDTLGYYLYLPATFIHDDLSLPQKTYAAKQDKAFNYVDTSANPIGDLIFQNAGNGNVVVKYTSGVALLQMPFFAMGHAIAKMGGYTADGFSKPYLVLLHLSTLFYVLWGMWLLMTIARRYFEQKIVILLLVTLALATNLYYFTVYNSPMSHGYLFFLYCGLIYATYWFYQYPGYLNALIIGAAAGMITMIRPVEIFCLLIPLLFAIRSFSKRVQFVGKYWKYYLSAVGVYVIPGLIQMSYWKYVTGNWIFYSYGNEGFDFLHPNIWNGLTHFHNGWLIYTPVMIFALIGIVFLYRRKDWFWSVVTFLPIHIYIAYSWWCWYYINGFGSRPMVETYALLAFPMGYMFVWMCKNRLRQWILYGFLLAFGALNIFQTYQLSLGIMWSETASKAYYFSTFGKTSLDYNDLVHYESNETQPNLQDIRKIETIFEKKYTKTDTINNIPARKVAVGEGSLESEKLELGEHNIRPGDHIRVTVSAYKKVKEGSWWNMSLLGTQVRRGDQNLKRKHIWIGNKINNENLSLWGGKAKEWGEVSYFFKIPNDAESTDVFFASVENYNGGPVFIAEMKIELWQ